MSKTKTTPKKKVTSPRKGVNKKTAGKAGPKGTMTTILIGLLMSLSFMSFAQGLVPTANYQLVNVPDSAAYTIVGITTYSPSVNTYAADVQFVSNYYQLYADEATLDTLSTYRISQPQYLYAVNGNYIVTKLTSNIFTSAQTIKADSMYRPGISGLDSFIVHVSVKTNLQPRVIQVNADDLVNNGHGKQYARHVKFVTAAPYPSY
jgi:hypothetical protein